MELTEKILKNFTISKPQRKFLIALVYSGSDSTREDQFPQPIALLGCVREDVFTPVFQTL